MTTHLPEPRESVLPTCSATIAEKWSMCSAGEAPRREKDTTQAMDQSGYWNGVPWGKFKRERRELGTERHVILDK